MTKKNEGSRSGSKIESFLFGLICLALIWIPFPGASNRVWSMLGWSSFIYLIGTLWVLAYLLGKTQVSSLIEKCLVPIGCLLAVQIWTVLQWYGWTQDHTASLYALLIGLAYSVLFVLILQLHSPSRIKALLTLIFISAVFQAFYGSMMVLTDLEWGFFVDKMYFKNQATGTFINPNHMAAYVTLGLSIGVAYLMVSSRQLKGREAIIGRTLNVLMSGSLAWRLALIVLVVGLVMSASRMGNVAFMIALFSAAVAYMIIKRRLMIAWIVLLASIILIDALIIGTRFGVDRLVEEVTTTVVSEESRLPVIQAALPMARDFFWFGSGAGSFYSTFPMYRVEPVGTDFYYHVHNDYLEFLIELGILGVIPLLIFVLLTLKAAYVACTSSSSNWIQISGYACFMSIVAIVVHSSADFSLRIPAYAATLITLMAVTYSAAYGQRRRRHRRV